MSVNCPQYETYEEALAHLHEYALQYAKRKEDDTQYEVFLEAHSPIEVFGGKWVVSLKEGHQPVSFVR
jgi:hypothetical protein